MLESSDYPTSVQFDFISGTFSPVKQRTDRHVSDLSMMFQDQEAAQEAIAAGDKLVYEIWYHPFETSRSDMAIGVTRILPGKVGDEFHMTKGHIHERDDQPEIYFCVKGEGYLLLQTMDGEFQAERWTAGTISHIPPMWAHRVVNTGKDLLVFVASYHLSAGHNYRPIIDRGFKRLVVERDGRAVFIHSERWE
ncbi:MAG: glucose-6-phosphate isomerase family protein [Anaerolineae bacterium]|jgi:glucose-6-phosphate isomerase